jgi:hypothetical protein
MKIYLNEGENNKDAISIVAPEANLTFNQLLTT